MTTREQYHIYQQEQPTDILRVGKWKREPSKLAAIRVSAEIANKVKQLTNDEEGQEEYLKRHGVI